jgi:hypothetical protein
MEANELLFPTAAALGTLSLLLWIPMHGWHLGGPYGDLQDGPNTRPIRGKSIITIPTPAQRSGTRQQSGRGPCKLLPWALCTDRICLRVAP